MGRGESKAQRRERYISSKWKTQLRQYAERGQMPTVIYGNREQQAQVLREIDKLYKMPDKGSAYSAKLTDFDARVVTRDSATHINRYPSGENATEAEKRGALKMLLYNLKKEGRL